MEDGYAWSVTEANAWMLRSNLSNGTVGLYRAICDALGQSLEAVTPQVLQEPRSSRNASAGEEADEASQFFNPGKSRAAADLRDEHSAGTLS